MLTKFMNKQNIFLQKWVIKNTRILQHCEDDAHLTLMRHSQWADELIIATPGREYMYNGTEQAASRGTILYHQRGIAARDSWHPDLTSCRFVTLHLEHI